jgi:hypothetical protein
MRLAKTLAIVACAGLLSAVVMGPARRACAQNEEQVDPEAGSWSADIDGSGELNPETKVVKPPLDIQGCWVGTMTDRAEGKGDVTFYFEQNDTNLGDPSSFSFYWNSDNYAEGPLLGSVSSKGFKFKGTATSKCSISGSGSGDAEKLRGKYTFKKECAVAFKGGTFTITPGACE